MTDIREFKPRDEKFLDSIDKAMENVELGIIGGFVRDKDGKVGGGLQVGVKPTENLTIFGKAGYYGRKTWNGFIGLVWKK